MLLRNSSAFAFELRMISLICCEIKDTHKSIANLTEQQCEHKYTHHPRNGHVDELEHVRRTGIVAHRNAQFGGEIEATNVGDTLAIVHPRVWHPILRFLIPVGDLTKALYLADFVIQATIAVYHVQHVAERARNTA